MAPSPGRAALRVVDNPPSPWRSDTIDWLGDPPSTELHVYEDASKSILSPNDSPDLGFTYSVNPYRGCYHGCAYCYARPSHQYLDFGAGTDFERKLVVKTDAPELLRKAFDRPSWKGEFIMFSGNTDCYQPLEATYGLTRRCLEVCLEYRNPVGVITKGALIERDAELLAELHRRAYCSVAISIPFFDADAARAIEPYVPKPERRIQVIATLAKAGVPVGVNVAPIIPGLNDQEVPMILRACREAGAISAWHNLVRLPAEVDDVFEKRLRAAMPLRADRILHQIEDCRGGRRNDPRFGSRHRGAGERWQIIEQLFEQTVERLGFPGGPDVPDPSPFRRPKAQGSLFDL